MYWGKEVEAVLLIALAALAKLEDEAMAERERVWLWVNSHTPSAASRVLLDTHPKTAEEIL